MGIIVHGAFLEARDLLVRATRPRISDGAFGMGVSAQTGARVVLEAARIERSSTAGVIAVGATILASDLVVSGVEPAPCARAFCDGEIGGYGLAARGGAIGATRFRVEAATACGALLIPDVMPTDMDLSSGVVTGSAVGVCLQVDGYDIDRLTRDVEYRDVGVPLQATSYVLPDALAGAP